MNVQLIPNFLSQDLCETFIQTYKDRVVPSIVVKSDSMHTKDASCTSSSYYIPNTDPHILALREKVATFLNIDAKQIEGIQFLRYLHGEKYNYHHDYLPGKPTNQRVHTILVYLNTLVSEEGGATSFYYYKKKIQPETGLGVWFRNMDDSGALISQSMHSGEPILKPGSVKYALNIWTRHTRSETTNAESCDPKKIGSPGINHGHLLPHHHQHPDRDRCRFLRHQHHRAG